MRTFPFKCVLGLLVVHFSGYCSGIPGKRAKGGHKTARKHDLPENNIAHFYFFFEYVFGLLVGLEWAKSLANQEGRAKSWCFCGYCSGIPGRWAKGGHKTARKHDLPENNIAHFYFFFEAISWPRMG